MADWDSWRLFRYSADEKAAIVFRPMLGDPAATEWGVQYGDRFAGSIIPTEGFTAAWRWLRSYNALAVA